MNGWRYDWVEALPVGIYDLLIDWLRAQAQETRSTEDDEF